MYRNILVKFGNKSGFTLIEALMATILVGLCILPIVGTMQNAETMTQHMVNDDRLSMIARSRMNLETSRANNEQLDIDTTSGWFYEFYKTNGKVNCVSTYAAPPEFFTLSGEGTDAKPAIGNMIKAYRIAVEKKDEFDIFHEDGAKDQEYLPGLNKVVITSQLVGEDGSFYEVYDANDNTKLDEKYEEETGQNITPKSITLTPPPKVRCVVIRYLLS